MFLRWLIGPTLWANKSRSYKGPEGKDLQVFSHHDGKP